MRGGKGAGMDAEAAQEEPTISARRHSSRLPCRAERAGLLDRSLTRHSPGAAQRSLRAKRHRSLARLQHRRLGVAYLLLLAVCLLAIDVLLCFIACQSSKNNGWRSVRKHRLGGPVASQDGGHTPATATQSSPRRRRTRALLLYLHDTGIAMSPPRLPRPGRGPGCPASRPAAASACRAAIAAHRSTTETRVCVRRDRRLFPRRHCIPRHSRRLHRIPRRRGLLIPRPRRRRRESVCAPRSSALPTPPMSLCPE